MPREQITHNRVVERTIATATYADTDSIGNHLTAVAHQEIPRRNVHIEWNRTGGSGALNVPYDTGWVQIAVEVTVAELRDILAAAEEQAKAEAVRYADMGDYDVDNHQFRVVSDVLDRRETNDAIRVLRRARNAAYGADE